MLEKRNIKLVVAYDGTNFQGFQYQPDQRTVQGVMEELLSELFQERVKVIGAGRTDAGVHALGQVVNFHARCPIPKERLVVAMNSILPADVRVQRASFVHLKFHARFDAKSRVYRYTIHERGVENPLTSRYAWHVSERVDVGRMQEATQYLVGVHDFRTFCKGAEPVENTVREVKWIKCTRRESFLTITIEASSFLRQMARIIVASLLEVGKGANPPEWIKEILEACDRKVAPQAAPPQGLCLLRVRY